MLPRRTIDWGIDLGNRNSSVAVFEGRDVKVIKNNSGNEVTPSAVFKKKIDDNIVKHIGNKAKQNLLNNYEHVATEFKQKLGLRDWYFEFPSTGEKATAVDLSAEILRELVKSVKQREGEDIYAAVITVPAAFLNPMYEDTKKAGEKAGIKYVEVLAESIAAALAYGLESDHSSKGRWLAYDLGGGTFDAALVKIEDGIFSVSDHEGLPYLGGKNLDALIVEKYLVPALPPSLKEKIVPWKSSSWWSLKTLAEEAKCQLSMGSEYTFDGIVEGHDFGYTLTRKRLDALETEIFAPTIEKCQEILKRNKFTSKDIDKVILIGEPTLSPHLREMIEKGLGIPVDFSIDPLTAVVKGAAIYAAGRKIPDEILNNTGIATEKNRKISIDIDLNYPSTTMDQDAMVAGVLKSKNKGVTISIDWSVEINRVDKAGNVLWASGKISLTEKGIFAKMVPLKEGKNEFNVVVLDSQKKVVATRGNTFSIAVTIVSDVPKLPRGIGIADAQGKFQEFFKKDTPLPAEKVITRHTAKELKKGEKGEICIPVLEGNEEKAYLNWHIDTLKIEAEELPVTIPKGSEMEISIKIYVARNIEVTAYFGDYDIEVSATMRTAMDIDVEKLSKDFDDLQNTISKLKKINDEEIKHIIENLEKENVEEDIKNLISQIKSDNPEIALQAMEKILELKKRLDPIIERRVSLPVGIGIAKYGIKTVFEKDTLFPAKNIIRCRPINDFKKNEVVRQRNQFTLNNIDTALIGNATTSKEINIKSAYISPDKKISKEVNNLQSNTNRGLGVQVRLVSVAGSACRVENRYRYQIKTEGNNESTRLLGLSGLTINIPTINSEEILDISEVQVWGFGTNPPFRCRPGEMIWGFLSDGSFGQKAASCLLIESVLDSWKPNDRIALEAIIVAPFSRLDAHVRVWSTRPTLNGGSEGFGYPDWNVTMHNDQQGIPACLLSLGF